MRTYISLMNGSPWGGSEDCWYNNLLEYLSTEPKSQPLVIVTAHNPQVKIALKHLGVRYEIAPWSEPGSRSLASKIKIRFLNQFRQIEILRDELLSLIPENGKVLINQGGSYCISNHPYLIEALVTKKSRFQLVCHSPILNTPTENQIQQMNYALEHCEKINVLSESAISDLKAFFIIDVKKVGFFKNPIKLDTVIPPETLPTKKSIGFVGRYTSAKGFDFCLRLLLDPSASNSISSAHFFGEGDIPTKLFEGVRKNAIEVFNHGLVSDKQKIYSQFDILLMPSRLEALPNVLIEAGLQGKFPLIPKIGSIPMIMPPNWNYYIDPLDFGTFKRQVLDFINRDHLEIQASMLQLQKNITEYQRSRSFLSF